MQHLVHICTSHAELLKGLIVILESGYEMLDSTQQMVNLADSLTCVYS